MPHDPTRDPTAADRGGPPDLGADAAAQYAAALDLLGLKPGRPKRGAIPVRTAAGRTDIDVSTARSGVAAAVGEARLSSVEASAPALACALAATLGLPIPDRLLDTPTTTRELTRPRLVERAAFVGQDRLACRREAFADAFYAVTIGTLPAARLLRTDDIDRWGVDFDAVLTAATERLAERVTSEHVHDLEGDDYLLAVIHPTEPLGCIHLIFDRLIDGHDESRGVVFAMPTPHTCLCLPVSPEAGAPGLARLVRTAYALAPEQSPDLARGLYWRVGGRTEVLPLTHIEETAGRRVQLDAIGAVAELLRALGELN